MELWAEKMRKVSIEKDRKNKKSPIRVLELHLNTVLISLVTLPAVLTEHLPMEITLSRIPATRFFAFVHISTPPLHRD